VTVTPDSPPETSAIVTPVTLLRSATIAVSAIGLAATGIAELLLAILTGSVGLLGDAIHNLSDVSSSAVVFLGFRLSRRGPTERYP
jgi:divalent metal cation (Fe/Co/Zn/Cd) transporter